MRPPCNSLCPSPIRHSTGMHSWRTLSARTLLYGCFHTANKRPPEMIIQAHLNFFRIDQCGLYKHGDDQAAGLGAQETFELIYNWVAGKPMEDTIPWDPRGSASNRPNCYCHDMYKCEDSDEFAFVLWKSEAGSVGSILGAQAEAQTGQSQVVEYTDNYKGKPVIWGRPCYYWIIPKLNTIVSIKFDHSVCDSNMLQLWIEKCITNRVQHPNKQKTTTNSGQVRFEFQKSFEDDQQRYAYRFTANLRSLETGHARIAELANRVTHLVRRETIKLNVGIDERKTWVKLFDKIPHVRAKPKAKTRQIEVRAEAKPTAQEMKKIIETFAQEHRRPSEWDRVGFDTDTGIVWVDSYRLHQQVPFNVQKDSVLTAVELFDRLSSLRNNLLGPVVADEKARAASGVAKAKTVRVA